MDFRVKSFLPSIARESQRRNLVILPRVILNSYRIRENQKGGSIHSWPGGESNNITMSHEAGGRERANSTAATNNRLKPPSNNDSGSMVPPGVDESPSQGSVEVGLETQENFAMGSKNQPAANSSPPRRSNYMTSSSAVEESAPRPRNKEYNQVLEPPVTKTTLSELDVNKIVHNPKLRHDINFDPDLHFRPNIDGEKGRRKALKADSFWGTFRGQLRVYLVDRENFEKDLGGAEWCLPATLKAIRGVLETLVPQRDRSSVEETFNVDMLMQQFRKGVADLPKLAIWLSQLLKCHCAPMRDTWVDAMVKEISKGDQDGDVALLVLGMRNLLGVLEAMKLVSSSTVHLILIVKLIDIAGCSKPPDPMPTTTAD